MVALPVPRWLALLACLIASAVPAAGLVVCLHEGDLEIGLGDECPCELPEDHPDCHHVDVDGGGDLVAKAPRVAPPVEVDRADAADVSVEPDEAALAPRGGRAPPWTGSVEPWRGGAEPPWIARHLDARRTTSLLV